MNESEHIIQIEIILKIFNYAESAVLTHVLKF